MTFNFTSDLSCYSLATNSNVPASNRDMNHYYSYRQQQKLQQQHGSLAGSSHSDLISTIKSQSSASSTASLNKLISNVHISSSSPSLCSTPEFKRMPSKLDVLIQTATSADFASSSPSPSKRSYSSSLEHLCNQAEKLNDMAFNTENIETITTKNPDLTSSSTVFAEAPLSKKTSSTEKKSNKRRKNQNFTTTNNTTNDSKDDSQNSANNILNNTTHSSNNHLAIKLASPSTNTKRQRSGPSCDCCRSRKIKCDSEIFILSTIDEIINNLSANENKSHDIPHNSHIAHCEFISLNVKNGYQYYKIIKDEEHALNNKLTSFNYLQFKPCSACVSKNLKCCFSKGFTRNDIIKFNKTEKLNSNSSLPLNTINPLLSSKSNSTSASETASPALSSSNLPGLVNVKSELDDSKFGLACNGRLDDNDITQDEILSDHSSIKTEKYNDTSLLPTPTPTPAPAPAHNINTDTSNMISARNSMIGPGSGSNGLVDKIPLSFNINTSTSTASAAINKKSSKKTSCKTCRFKKIKCVRTNGSEVCSYCNKKSISCVFE